LVYVFVLNKGELLFKLSSTKLYFPVIQFIGMNSQWQGWASTWKGGILILETPGLDVFR